MEHTDRAFEGELDPVFEITTSLRWNAVLTNAGNYSKPLDLAQLDGIPLTFHRDRMLFAAQTFHWQDVIGLLSGSSGLKLLHSQLLAFSPNLPSQKSIYKLRLTISLGGEISITASPPLSSSLFLFSLPTPSRLTTSSLNQPPTAVLYLSPLPIRPSPHTNHKTTHRTPYTTVISHLPPSITSLSPTTAEVLLYNPSGHITECVYSTPYFQRNGDFITPDGSCGGNFGVTRRLALEKGWCKSGIISKESLWDGEVIWLSNAVRGFWEARIELKMPTK